TLDNDVLRTVAAHVAPIWKKFAKDLKLTDSEVKSISLLHVRDKDCTMDMLHRWREQMACSRDKLRPLILACRKAELDGLANEIEQGEDGGSGLPRRIQMSHKLELEEHDLTQRVYHMLLDWRVIQPFEADKQLVLAEALRSFGLNDLGLEVCRGLSLRILDHVSKSIGKSWKLFGQKLGLSDEDIGRVTDRGNDTNTARSILHKWKRRQDRSVDLLGVLSEALSACKKPKLAQMVIKGMDDDVLEIIANMMEHKLDDILMALRVPERVRFGTKDRGPPTTVELLKWWRACRLDGASNGRELLHSVLQRYGCHDAATLLWPCSTPTSEAAAAGEAEDLWQPKWPPAPAPATAPPQLIPQDVTTAVVLAEIGKVPCQPINLAAILDVPKTKRDRIFKGWSEMSKRNFFLLRDWVDRHEGVYPGHNLGMQLCKILLEAGLVEHANLIVQGASANKEFFEQTDFQSTVPGEDEDVYYQAQTDVHRSPVGYDKDLIVADPTTEDGGLLLDVDSVVEVRLRGNSYSGLIRSIEKVPEWPDGEIAGIELEDPIVGGTDGSFEGKQYFNCRPGRAVFLYLSQCRPDSRFPTGEATYRYYRRETSQDFGGVDSPIEPGYISPQRFDRGSVGRNKGIQGDQNSCYLDVTLYSMFSFNETFDRMLLRDGDAADLPQFRAIQNILKEAIVNPLRKHGFVRADRVRNLRLKLDELNLLPGLTNEEKDPEEFIHTLLKDVFKSQPLFKTRHGDTKEIDTHYLYQIFMDKNDSLDLPRVEQLLHQSFLDNELKFVEIPDCLIVQMPRFGKDYKMYQRILPSLTINITDLLENYPRQCTICGQLATLECRDCRPDVGICEEFIKSFCESCFIMTHERSKPHHKKKALTVSEEIRSLSQELESHEPLFQPQMMELFAVVCIQTSHYVAFVRAEPQSDQWVFFDSMADRDASHTPGFNIPIITHLPGFEKQVQDEARIKGTPDDKKLPEHLRRLLADSYICFYRRIDSKRRDPPKEWVSGATNY
ncbi:uncharacterized protein, partial [Diadema antillarum]|uniref:uncharacterized protein n=1 Tax=Diadema antillarum TaxID=105358 RepID=UPI003A8AC81F